MDKKRGRRFYQKLETLEDRLNFIEENFPETETLPLYLKAEVLENTVVVWADDEPEMSYYLYRWRRLIEDNFLIRQNMTV